MLFKAVVMGLKRMLVWLECGVYGEKGVQSLHVLGWSPCWLVRGNPSLTKPVVLAWLLRAPSFTLMLCPS